MATWNDLIDNIGELNALELLDEVKGVLKITWDDEDTELQGMIVRGMNNLNDLTGVELDYTTTGQAKALLLQHCRYEYNNAIEYFEENFKKEILRLQLKTGVAEMADDENA